VNFTRITEAADPSGIGSLLAIVFSVLFMLNLILGAFNLLPVPPLDGNVGITILMSEERARSFLDLFRQPSFAMMGLLLAWVVFGRIFSVIWTVALNVLYAGITTYGSF
jgi:Zn-dependent protease